MSIRTCKEFNDTSDCRLVSINDEELTLECKDFLMTFPRIKADNFQFSHKPNGDSIAEVDYQFNFNKMRLVFHADAISAQNVIHFFCK